MEKSMDSNIIDYYVISCAIPLIITIENCYQIGFGKSDYQYDFLAANFYLFIEKPDKNFQNPWANFGHRSSNEYHVLILTISCPPVKWIAIYIVARADKFESTVKTPDNI